MSISYKKFKIFCVALLLSLYVVVVFVINFFDWDVIEVWTYLIAIFLSNILPILYLFITEKNVNLKKYLESKKENISKKIFLKSNFDIERLKTLENEITILKHEIEELQREIGKLKIELSLLN